MGRPPKGPMLSTRGTRVHGARPSVLTFPVLSVDMLRVSRLGHRGGQLGTGEVPVSPFSAGGTWGGCGRESWTSQGTGT